MTLEVEGETFILKEWNSDTFFELQKKPYNMPHSVMKTPGQKMPNNKRFYLYDSIKIGNTYYKYYKL